MVILKRNIKLLFKRVKASSLVEAITATILLMLVFGIAFLTVNNILKSSFSNNTKSVEIELDELCYLYQNGKIELPFDDELGKWEISIYKERNKDIVVFEAEHIDSKKKISKEVSVYETY